MTPDEQKQFEGLGKLICACGVYNDGDCPRLNKVKDFTTSLLEARKKKNTRELLEEIEGLIPKEECLCGLMQDEACLGQCVGGFNSALEAVKDIIRNNSKE